MVRALTLALTLLGIAGWSTSASAERERLQGCRPGSGCICDFTETGIIGCSPRCCGGFDCRVFCAGDVRRCKDAGKKSRAPCRNIRGKDRRRCLLSVRKDIASLCVRPVLQQCKQTRSCPAVFALFGGPIRAGITPARPAEVTLRLPVQAAVPTKDLPPIPPPQSPDLYRLRVDGIDYAGEAVGTAGGPFCHPATSEPPLSCDLVFRTPVVPRFATLHLSGQGASAVAAGLTLDGPPSELNPSIGVAIDALHFHATGGDRGVQLDVRFKSSDLGHASIGRDEIVVDADGASFPSLPSVLLNDRIVIGRGGPATPPSPPCEFPLLVAEEAEITCSLGFTLPGSSTAHELRLGGGSYSASTPLPALPTTPDVTGTWQVTMRSGDVLPPETCSLELTMSIRDGTYFLSMTGPCGDTVPHTLDFVGVYDPASRTYDFVQLFSCETGSGQFSPDGTSVSLACHDPPRQDYLVGAR